MSRLGQGSVGALRSWFKQNPGEWLTYPDIVLKFGFKDIACAKQGVYVLKHEGVLKSGHVIYSDPDRPA